MESYINLGNPRPSEGYNALLGNIPASNPPSVGSLASMTPSVSNNVKEVMTNAVASYPVFAKPYKAHFERYLHPGDLIFVLNDEKAAGYAGTERRGKPCILANLPLLNHFLSLKGTRQNDVPQAFTDADNWNWLGVMRNDMQVTGGAPGAGRIYRKPQYQRLINVDVRGATRTFNYWASAKAGDTLYLRRVTLDRLLLETGDIDSAILSKKAVEAARGDMAKMQLVQQFVPSIMKPDLRDAVDTDFKTMSAFTDSEQSPLKTDNKSMGGGDLIKVGYCFQHVGSGERVYDRAAVMAALTFQDDRFRLPLLPMFVCT